MRCAVIGHAVGRHHHRGVRLVDRIGDRGGPDVVVVGSAGEAPAVGRVAPGVGVRRVAHVDAADRGPSLAVHSGDGVGGRVRCAVIGHAIGRHHHRGVRLVDGQRSVVEGSEVVVSRTQRPYRRCDRVTPGVDCGGRIAGVGGVTTQRSRTPQPGVRLTVHKPANGRRERRVHTAVIGLALVVCLHRQMDCRDLARTAGRRRQIVVTGRSACARREVARCQAGRHRRCRRDVLAVIAARGLVHREAFTANQTRDTEVCRGQGRVGVPVIRLRRIANDRCR